MGSFVGRTVGSDEIGWGEDVQRENRLWYRYPKEWEVSR